MISNRIIASCHKQTIVIKTILSHTDIKKKFYIFFSYVFVLYGKLLR